MGQSPSGHVARGCSGVPAWRAKGALVGGKIRPFKGSAMFNSGCRRGWTVFLMQTSSHHDLRDYGSVVASA